MIEDPAKPEEDNSAILLLCISLFHYKIFNFFLFLQANAATRPQKLNLKGNFKIYKFTFVQLAF